MGKSSNPTFAGDKEFEKIHLKEKFSYGLGDVACNVVYALTTARWSVSRVIRVASVAYGRLSAV